MADRAEEARRAIEQEGAYYRDFRGQPKPHPALAAGALFAVDRELKRA